MLFTFYFHTFIDLLLTAISLGTIFYAPFSGNFIQYLGAGIALFLLYPIPLEILLLIYGKLTYSDARWRKTYENNCLRMAEYNGLIYSESYNMTACGLEKMHPFDAIKYKR